MRPYTPLEDRLWAKISPEPNSGCWLWLGCVDRDGYGQTRAERSDGSKAIKAHRAMYEVMRGPIPPGMTIDHKCRVKSCVNPDHLEPVTNQENIRRAVALITHCSHGHMFTKENTGVSCGVRYCRICKRAQYRKWYAKGGRQ